MEAPVTAGLNISVTSLSQQVDHGAPASSSALSSLPQVTTSQSPEYRHRMAEVVSRATLNDPLNMLFEQEKPGGGLTPATCQQLYVAAKRRLDTKVEGGASVVEAGNFAAVGCWEPPSSIAPLRTESQLEEIARERPTFAQFVREMEAAKVACFGSEGQAHWNLSLMARDPNRKDKGAVRAVIEPYLAKVKQQGLPVWLVAGNARARDVYAYFGFRVVETLYSYPKERVEGDGSEAVLTWCMVYNWPPE
jgi:hypothetical protein